MRKIRVLIVDDSALVRKILSTGLANDPEIEVIGTAQDPYAARDILVEQKPDVITLDVEMPKMDGVSFLKKFMHKFPTPTVMISSLTEQGKRITIEALEAGAVDIIEKPKIGLTDKLPEMMADICKRVKAAARVNVKYLNKTPAATLKSTMSAASLDQSTDKVIAIGSSTGGVEGLARILPLFPAGSPGIVIVQHMPSGFTKSFAERLDKICPTKVKEAKHNDRVTAGTILIAPGGNQHMEVYRSGGEYRVRLVTGEKVTGHRPSVDVIFKSVARYVGKNTVAVLMTGMGKDGAHGLLEIKNEGGITFAQDSKTSVVWGMPGAAVEIGAAQSEVSLDDIPKECIEAIKKI